MQLQRNIAIHAAQIQVRSIHLDKYHFLQYNLQEALHSQPEIKL
ncbi:MAG: hypothetical protein R2781_07085 [Flavobacteriaceae bacterium]